MLSLSKRCLQINGYIDKLDRKYQIKLAELLEKYRKLGKIQQYLFDFRIDIQLSFAASVVLVQSVGIKSEDILKSEKEIDNYFCGKV